MKKDNGIILHRETTACFTGHRPEKLPDGGSRHSTATRMIKSMLYARVVDAVNDGYDTFITGMQRGIDLWAGEIVLSLMAKNSLRLICAIPYEGFGKEFTGVDRWTFERILEAASAKVTLCPHYTKDCMALRNKFMVDNSSRLIAVVDDPKSGTGQTLRYARSAKLDIRMLDLGELFPKKISARDFEANKHSYDVITFDSIEADMYAASRSTSALPAEADNSAAAEMFAEPISDPKISKKIFANMSCKEIAEKSAAEKSADMIGKMSAKASGKASAETDEKAAAKPLDNRDSEISKEKISGNSHHSQASPGADLEIDERYSAANDPTLTLL